MQTPQLNSDCCFFYLTKTLKSIQACDVLVGMNYGEDALVLARSAFENYLQIVYAVQSPVEHERYIEGRAGLSEGTHRHPLKRNGKPNFAIIEEVNSGVKFAPISRKAMADLSPLQEDRELYELLYDHLSSHAHPDMRTMAKYVDDDGFSAVGRGSEGEAHLVAYLLAAMNLDAVVKLSGLPRLARLDAIVLLRQIKKKGVLALKELSRTCNLELIDILCRRIAKIGPRW